MANLFDWSSTASSNTTLDGISVGTGMSVSNTDDAIRSLMALVRNTFSSTLQSFLAGSSPLAVTSGGTGATSLTGLTLPDAVLSSPDMTSPTIDSASVPTVSGTAPLYFTRASVACDGRSTNGACTLDFAKNIASVTRTTAGTYAVAFTTAAPSTSYRVVITLGGSSTFVSAVVEHGTKATSGFTIYCWSWNGSGFPLGDPQSMNIDVLW